MDIGKSISFTFEDEDWLTKIVIGAAFLLIPFVGWIATFGYMVRLVENVMRGEERPLPAWKDLGDMFTKGALLFVVQLVYGIPQLVMICAPLSLLIPLALAGDSEKLQALLGGLSLITLGGVGCLVFLYWVFLLFINPAIVVQFVRTGKIGACFRVGEIFAYFTSRQGDYLKTVGGVVVAILATQVVTTMVSSIPCAGLIAAIVLAFPATFLMYVVIGHLYGQLARLYQ